MVNEMVKFTTFDFRSVSKLFQQTLLIASTNPFRNREKAGKVSELFLDRDAL